MLWLSFFQKVLLGRGEMLKEFRDYALELMNVSLVQIYLKNGCNFSRIMEGNIIR